MQQIERYFRKASKAIARFFKRVASGSVVDIAILATSVALIGVLITIGVMSFKNDDSRPADGSALSEFESSEEISSKETSSGKLDVDSSPYADIILPKTEDGGQSYVDETLFIGDSNTFRLAEYRLTSWQNNLSAVGMGIQHVTSTPCMYFKGSEQPVYLANAVAMMQPQRIIITFGTNNTSSAGVTFQKQYRAALDAITDAWPYADIIINAIPPVAQTRTDSAATQEAIDEFNLKLAELAKEDGYHFLNSSEVLKNEKTGFAKAEYMIDDGLHLNEKGATAWMNYVRMHTFTSKDRRPALKPIPTHVKTPESVFNSSAASSESEESNELVTVTFRVREGKEFGKLTGTLEQKVGFNKKCTTVKAVPKSASYGLTWGCDHGRITDIHNGTLTFTVPVEDIKTVDIWVDFHKHEFGDWKDAGDGKHRHACKICGAVENGKHIPGNWEKNPDNKNEQVKYCTVCGALMDKKETAASSKPASSSSKPASSSSKPASSSSKPAASSSKPTPPASSEHVHSWDAGTVTKAPTCNAEGVKTFTCTVCGAKRTEAIAPDTNAHQWNAGEVTTAPGCETAGVKTYTCTVCGHTKTETISPTGHDFSLTEDVDGVTYQKCSHCGKRGDAMTAPPEESGGNEGGGTPPEAGSDGQEPT